MIAKIRGGRIVEVCNNIFTSTTEIREEDTFEELDELPGREEDVEEIVEEAPTQPVRAKNSSRAHIMSAVWRK